MSTDGGPASTVVWSWGQKGNEGPLATSNWVVDGAEDANEGSTAAHPPAMVALTPVDLTIDCGGQAHTELSFYLARDASGPTLDLLVDGASRFVFSGDDPHDNGPFEKYVFDVPQGVHTYTFRAQATKDAATSFAIDSFQCKIATPAIAPNATVDFDKGFIPPEARGSWVVDNAADTYSDGSTTTDEAAIHPPPLQANTPVEMTFDCGQSTHTELSFYIRRSSSGPTLDFLMDGASRFVFAGDDPHDNGPFEKYVFDVPRGTHTYTFRAHSTSDSATSFVIDYFQCKDVPPAVATNATVDFDKGFIPPETLGTWLVDNAIDTFSDGSTTTDEAAIHPPPLNANVPAQMTFDCEQSPHTELSFYIRRNTSGPTLDFLMDGASRFVFSGDVPHVNGPFQKYVFDVPQGTHTYTFSAHSGSDSASSFVIDYFQCKNLTPAVATNGTVDFDKGFIPPESSGGWQVDNAVDLYSDGSTTTDEAAIHPPTLQANTPVDMTFDCGQNAGLSFYVRRLASGPTLDFLVDGISNSVFNGDKPHVNGPFEKSTVAATSGPHTYTFRASSTTDASTSFVVDFLQCTP